MAKDTWKYDANRIGSSSVMILKNSQAPPQRRLLLDAGPMMIVSRPWPASTLSVLTPATVEPTLSAMSTTTNLSASVLKVTLETLKLDVSKVGVLS